MIATTGGPLVQRTDTGRASLALVPDARTPEEAAPTRVELLARAVDAEDLLVLRQVSPGRLLQIGGAGRGAGWAGSLELRLDEEPALRVALEAQRVLRWDAPEASPVVGPYYARSAALVPLDHDLAVLLGGDRPLPEDAALLDVARAAAAVVGRVSPAKRLADELEVLSALRTVLHLPPSALRPTLEHVARTAAAALSCEVAIAWLPEQDEVVVVEQGWSLGARAGVVAAALAAVRAAALPLPLCVQDSTTAPLPAPLDPASGVRSHYVLPLGAPSNGLLVLLHTAARPRGFTSLCRLVGERVAEAGGVVVQGSVVRAELEAQVRAAQAAARRDPLTGLHNRLGWDEALATCDPGSAPGDRPVALVVVDLNGLKAVNDRYGHDAGDGFLRRAAAAVRACARRGDVVARLGGDEFGLLLPGADDTAASAVAARLREAVLTAGGEGDDALEGAVLSAAVGVAVRAPGERLHDLWCRADAAMYQDKAATP